jgi:hypothetical protein
MGTMAPSGLVTVRPVWLRLPEPDSTYSTYAPVRQTTSMLPGLVIVSAPEIDRRSALPRPKNDTIAATTPTSNSGIESASGGPGGFGFAENPGVALIHSRAYAPSELVERPVPGYAAVAGHTIACRTGRAWRL